MKRTLFVVVGLLALAFAGCTQKQEQLKQADAYLRHVSQQDSIAKIVGPDTVIVRGTNEEWAAYDEEFRSRVEKLPPEDPRRPGRKITYATVAMGENPDHAARRLHDILLNEDGNSFRADIREARKLCSQAPANLGESDRARAELLAHILKDIIQIVRDNKIGWSELGTSGKEVLHLRTELQRRS